MLADLLRFASDPSISGVLLAIGFAGLLIEMQTLHLVAGAIGASGLCAVFRQPLSPGQHPTAWPAALAAIGVVGVLLELHVVPGHGVFSRNLSGLLALFAAIVFAFGFPFAAVAAQSIAIAIVLTVVIFVVAARVFPQNAFMHRLAFTGVQGKEYVAAPDQRALIGLAWLRDVVSAPELRLRRHQRSKGRRAYRR